MGVAEGWGLIFTGSFRVKDPISEAKRLAAWIYEGWDLRRGGEALPHYDGIPPEKL